MLYFVTEYVRSAKVNNKVVIKRGVHVVVIETGDYRYYSEPSSHNITALIQVHYCNMKKERGLSKYRPVSIQSNVINNK